MADNDNKELIEFLEKKFDGIEKQFDGIEKRFDGIEKQFDDIEKRLELKITAAKEESMRHTGVLIEDVHHKLGILVEGMMGVNERRDAIGTIKRMNKNTPGWRK